MHSQKCLYKGLCPKLSTNQRYNLAQAMSRVKGEFNIKKQINTTFPEYKGGGN